MNNTNSFKLIEPDIGYGNIPPIGWRSVTAANLAILVGVTGVGKSRTIEELTNTGLTFTLLPNRRILTDHLIIGELQALDGVQAKDGIIPIVHDRIKRFDYTRRYRERFAGGMAHALSQLWVAPELASGLIFFDGLRGVNEVSYAAQQMRQARFIALCAPDGIRVQRLLDRNDAFDQMQLSTTAKGTSDAKRREVDKAGLIDRFPDAVNLSIDPTTQQHLMRLLEEKIITHEEIAAKLAIVSEERRNYDPDATVAALQSSAPERLCMVDTVAQGPEECAQQIQAWLD